MRPCHTVEIHTPEGVALNGLWFGPKRPKRAILWVHGLGSSTFSKLSIVDHLIDASTAVLTFNNRGSAKVSSSSLSRKKRNRAGAAHEVFTECVDDIEGAIRFARKQGAQEIYLAGHSTGCQKSAYWAAKKGRGVKGIILLAPVSDYAAAVHLDGKAKIARALSEARKLIKAGRPHELLTEKYWQWSQLADAQRFVSLYSGESEEEIFTYWDPKRNPKTLRAIKQPLLVILAEKDEYADRPAEKMQDWFAEHMKVGDEIEIIKKSPHGFQGVEKKVANGIKKWILGGSS